MSATIGLVVERDLLIQGFVVKRILPGSLAAVSGSFRIGDIIRTVNNQPVGTPSCLAPGVITGDLPGSRISLEVLRGDKILQIYLKMNGGSPKKTPKKKLNAGRSSPYWGLESNRLRYTMDEPLGVTLTSPNWRGSPHEVGLLEDELEEFDPTLKFDSLRPGSGNSLSRADMKRPDSGQRSSASKETRGGEDATVSRPASALSVSGVRSSRRPESSGTKDSRRGFAGQSIGSTNSARTSIVSENRPISGKSAKSDKRPRSQLSPKSQRTRISDAVLQEAFDLVSGEIFPVSADGVPADIGSESRLGSAKTETDSSLETRQDNLGVSSNTITDFSAVLYSSEQNGMKSDCENAGEVSVAESRDGGQLDEGSDGDGVEVATSAEMEAGLSEGDVEACEEVTLVEPRIGGVDSKNSGTRSEGMEEERQEEVDAQGVEGHGETEEVREEEKVAKEEEHGEADVQEEGQLKIGEEEKPERPNTGGSKEPAEDPETESAVDQLNSTAGDERPPTTSDEIKMTPEREESRGGNDGAVAEQGEEGHVRELESDGGILAMGEAFSDQENVRVRMTADGDETSTIGMSESINLHDTLGSHIDLRGPPIGFSGSVGSSENGETIFSGYSRDGARLASPSAKKGSGLRQNSNGYGKSRGAEISGESAAGISVVSPIAESKSRTFIPGPSPRDLTKSSNFSPGVRVSAPRLKRGNNPSVADSVEFYMRHGNAAWVSSARKRNIASVVGGNLSNISQAEFDALLAKEAQRSKSALAHVENPLEILEDHLSAEKQRQSEKEMQIRKSLHQVKIEKKVRGLSFSRSLQSLNFEEIAREEKRLIAATREFLQPYASPEYFRADGDTPDVMTKLELSVGTGPSVTHGPTMVHQAAATSPLSPGYGLSSSMFSRRASLGGYAGGVTPDFSRFEFEREEHSRAYEASVEKKLRRKMELEIERRVLVEQREKLIETSNLAPAETFGNMHGGRFMAHSAVHESYFAEAARKASLTPGPGAYSAADPRNLADNPKLHKGPPTFASSSTASVLDLKMIKGAEGPGPGEYNTAVKPNLAGCAFPSSKHEYLATEIRHGMQIPGPAYYMSDNAFDNIRAQPRGAAINLSNAPNPQEHVVNVLSENPGPGRYEVKRQAVPAMGGGGVGSVMERTMKTSSSYINKEWSNHPGVGMYDIEPKDNWKRGVSVGTGQRSNFTAAKNTPGPGDYDYADGRKIRSVQISKTNVPSELERAIKKSQRAPYGPGYYAANALGSKAGIVPFSTDANRSRFAAPTVPTTGDVGPGEYEISAGQHSTKKGPFIFPRREMYPEDVQREAAKIPGPGQYGAGTSENSKPHTLKKTAEKMGTVFAPASATTVGFATRDKLSMKHPGTNYEPTSESNRKKLQFSSPKSKKSVGQEEAGGPPAGLVRYPMM